MADTLAPAPAPARRSPGHARALAWARDNGVYVALAIILVIDVLLLPNFFSVDNIQVQLLQLVPVAIVALGMALVIGTEGIDLSVGAVMALAAAVLPLYLGYGVVVSIVMALVVAAVVGLVNGWLIAFIGVQPIVATLALLVGGRGIALVIADGQSKQIRVEGLLAIGRDSVLGIPYPVIIAAVLVAAVAFLVRRTTFGRQLVAIGGNRVASDLAGLPVRRVLITVYVIAALLAGVAGVIATSRLTASDPSSIGQLIELSAITAVVVGGTPLTGGRVRIIGTVAGALLIQLITATLIAQNVPDAIGQMVQAAIIIAAVYVQRGRGGEA